MQTLSQVHTKSKKGIRPGRGIDLGPPAAPLQKVIQSRNSENATNSITKADSLVPMLSTELINEMLMNIGQKGKAQAFRVTGICQHEKNYAVLDSIVKRHLLCKTRRGWGELCAHRQGELDTCPASTLMREGEREWSCGASSNGAHDTR